MNEELDNLYPIRICEYKTVKDKAVVVYDKFEKTWLDKFIKSKKKRVAEIKLDDIGTFIWLLCDGNNTVAEIKAKAVSNFEKQEKMNERVILFLNQLESKKFIRFYERKSL